MLYQTQGIILKRTDFSETSQLFSIYSSGLGKIEVIGRGTKKIKSKLNSQMQFFAVIDLEIARGKNFDQLTGASVLKNFNNIKINLAKTLLASFGLELVDRLTKPWQDDEKIFNLLFHYFEIVNGSKVESKDYYLKIKDQFIIQLLSFLGYKPTSDVIASSNKLKSFLENQLEVELKTKKAIDYFRLD
ncbi:MAG: DNA repair protein RecO [Candidatus Buchananbacteria bacterium RIFCSPHIGHO2_01_FULL_39_8]|uniref:DNA repair protein RecO n=1 Tax=Candidatus Buchananbacteria bacterium RIFCSPHIGHO2_01_FULL_39_8 TaxID=1797533 RepID=A0A1G1Y054_9BACT|nr:MAG: DNA repair protein RecO [Candidatus Buchananbacteria bacterium RIFCSPHIGHO2_01_FULL_39_8]